VDRSLHSALEKFFAVTGSLDTLNNLIQLLEANNSSRQQMYDLAVQDPGRFINVRRVQYTVQEMIVS